MFVVFLRNKNLPCISQVLWWNINAFEVILKQFSAIFVGLGTAQRVGLRPLFLEDQTKRNKQLKFKQKLANICLFMTKPPPLLSNKPRGPSLCSSDKFRFCLNQNLVSL